MRYNKITYIAPKTLESSIRSVSVLSGEVKTNVESLRMTISCDNYIYFI